MAQHPDPVAVDDRETRDPVTHSRYAVRINLPKSFDIMPNHGSARA